VTSSVTGRAPCCRSGASQTTRPVANRFASTSPPPPHTHPHTPTHTGHPSSLSPLPPLCSCNTLCSPVHTLKHTKLSPLCALLCGLEMCRQWSGDGVGVEPKVQRLVCRGLRHV
jgi:hypothetical protein